MSIVITYKNIEQLVFYDKELQNKLSEFKGLFSTWAFASKQPSLKLTAQKSLMELLRQLDDEHIKIIADHYKTDVKVEKIDLGVVHNFSLPIDEAENLLNGLPSILKESYFVYRDEKTLYISFWR